MGFFKNLLAALTCQSDSRRAPNNASNSQEKRTNRPEPPAKEPKSHPRKQYRADKYSSPGSGIQSTQRSGSPGPSNSRPDNSKQRNSPHYISHRASSKSKDLPARPTDAQNEDSHLYLPQASRQSQPRAANLAARADPSSSQAATGAELPLEYVNQDASRPADNRETKIIGRKSSYSVSSLILNDANQPNIDLPPQVIVDTAVGSAAESPSSATSASSNSSTSLEFSDDESQQLVEDTILTPLLGPQSPDIRDRKCLVLDLDETLVHSSFKYVSDPDFVIPVEIEDRKHDVHVVKRPHVDAFLETVCQLYEVVVFTASVARYGDPLLDILDPKGLIHHRLFRESCVSIGGSYIKNLSLLGRPLKDVIIIDNSPASYAMHPQHAVPVSSWFSDVHDSELLDMLPFLCDLAGSKVNDVSVVLDVSLEEEYYDAPDGTEEQIEVD